MSLQETIGKNIRDHRIELGWIQKELSKKTGLTIRTLGRVERGEVDVKISTLFKISSALGVSVAELLT